MTRPTITVVVPVYNAERFLDESLRAVLGQTRPPDEVVVVDDGSTDGTGEVLRRFAGDVRVIRQENAGHAAAYNRGFAAARGDFVARSDADDVWLPAKLARQEELLRRHPEVDVAMTAAWVFGREERLFGDPPGDGVLDPVRFARALYTENSVCSSTVLVRRRLFERIGPFAPGLACEDYDFWLRAAAAGAVFAHDPEVLVRYRRHEANVTNDLLAMFRAAHLVHRRHAGLVDDPRLVRRVLALDLERIGRLLVDQERVPEARRTYRASLRRRPTPSTTAWALLLSLPARQRVAAVAAALRVKRRLAVPAP